MMRRFSGAAMVAVLMTWFAAGCGPKVVQPDSPRPASDPAKIKFYQKAPGHYEDLGMVEVTENVQYEEGFKADGIGDALKAKAAAKGANGILLESPPGPEMYTVGAFYKGQYLMFPVRRAPNRAAMGRAIYVLE